MDEGLDKRVLEAIREATGAAEDDIKQVLAECNNDVNEATSRLIDSEQPCLQYSWPLFACQQQQAVLTQVPADPYEVVAKKKKKAVRKLTAHPQPITAPISCSPGQAAPSQASLAGHLTGRVLQPPAEKPKDSSRATESRRASGKERSKGDRASRGGSERLGERPHDRGRAGPACHIRLATAGPGAEAPLDPWIPVSCSAAAGARPGSGAKVAENGSISAEPSADWDQPAAPEVDKAVAAPSPRCDSASHHSSAVLSWHGLLATCLSLPAYV